MPGGLTTFAYPYFNSHPYTGDEMFKAVSRAFGHNSHVPDCDDIGHELSDEQMAYFKYAYLQVWKNDEEMRKKRVFRRGHAKNFLTPYRGCPVRDVVVWKASMTWGFLYFLEQR